MRSFFTDRVVVEEDFLALVPRQFHFDGMRDVADGEVERMVPSSSPSRIISLSFPVRKDFPMEA